MKRFAKWAAIGLFVLVLATVLVYHVTSWRVSELHVTSVNDVPPQKVALVLGTSNYLSNGNTNLYFKYRIDAAEKLFNAGKVEYILVSGDNRKANYNEPKQMLEALQQRGIPKEKIYLDYAGFRTLASVVRANKVFGLDGFVVVSQRFHNQRALYIAQSKGIKAYGFNAQEVTHAAGFKTILREYLARVKMMLDLYILQTEPKFLGDQISIGET